MNPEIITVTKYIFHSSTKMAFSTTELLIAALEAKARSLLRFSKFNQQYSALQ